MRTRSKPRPGARPRPGLRVAPAGVLAAALALLTACAALEGDHAVDSTAPARDVELSNVPFFPQEASDCGPASLAMALAWSGVAADPQGLAAQVYSPTRNGTLPTEMVGAARRNGRIAYPVSTLPDLLAELKAGNPVIVLQRLGAPWNRRWHFAVAIGYDLSDREIVLHSGTEPRQVQSIAAFERAWEPGGNWGLVVLAPSKLPATAREEVFIDAAIGLERSSHWDGAAEACAAALTLWPKSLPALMGLGNSRYALGDLAGAERAFRQAAVAHPGAGPAFNNLAEVLAEMGRREEALAAARMAVATGGPLEKIYRRTLAKIESTQDETRSAAPAPLHLP